MILNRFWEDWLGILEGFLNRKWLQKLIDFLIDFFDGVTKYYIYTMHHATCQSITARTAALLATKRQLKKGRNASSVIVRAQEFIATDKAPAAAGPYSQGIKVYII